MKKLSRKDLLKKHIDEFCAISDGAEKKKKLEYIRQTFGNDVAEKARKASPSFKFNR